jgi:hypothetical protein
VHGVKIFLKGSFEITDDFDWIIRDYVSAHLNCAERAVSVDDIDIVLIQGPPARSIKTKEEGSVSFFPPHCSFCDSDVLIEVSGYAYPSRMANITKRLEAIARVVKLELGGRCKVSIAFLPVQEGCWYAG